MAMDEINRIAAELLRPTKMPRFRYWRHSDDNQAFAYTTQKVDGKFWAIKYRINKKQQKWTAVKKVPFGRRKKAKERAYHWYCQRKPVFEKLTAKKTSLQKPLPTKAEILQKKIRKCEGYIRRHSIRLKLTKTLLKKWEQKKKYYEKKLRKLPK